MTINNDLTCINNYNSSVPIRTGLSVLMIGSVLRMKSIFNVLQLLITANLLKYFFKFK